jgi:hypothetical protein
MKKIIAVISDSQLFLELAVHFFPRMFAGENIEFKIVKTFEELQKIDTEFKALYLINGFWTKSKSFGEITREFVLKNGINIYCGSPDAYGPAHAAHIALDVIETTIREKITSLKQKESFQNHNELYRESLMEALLILTTEGKISWR